MQNVLMKVQDPKQVTLKSKVCLIFDYQYV